MLNKSVFAVIFLLFLTLHAQTARAESSCRFLMAWLNAQNFVYGDDIQSPRDMSKKIAALAAGISTMNDGNGPDLLGLGEVSTVSLLRDVTQNSLLQDKNYQTVVTSGHPDLRGIDVGLISKFPLVALPVSHIYWNSTDPVWRHSDGAPAAGPNITRPILEVNLRLPNKEILTVFLNHWYSRQARDQRQITRRLLAAKYLRGLVEAKLKENPDANIAVMGDFNTGPWDVEMITGLGNKIPQQKDDGDNSILYNLADAFYGRPACHGGTYLNWRFHQWSAFDQIMVSKSFLQYYLAGTYSPVKAPPFVDKKYRPRSFNAKNRPKGVSDHLPVAGAFDLSLSDTGSAR